MKLFNFKKLSMLIAGFTLVTSPALAEISLRLDRKSVV